MELFYLAPDGWLVAVKIERTSDGEPVLGIPERLFAANTYAEGGGGYSYTVGPDGRRFLVSAFVERPQAPISLILSRRPLAVSGRTP